MTERRERQQSDPRVIAKIAGDARRLDGDFGKCGGCRHLGHRGVGDQDGAAAGQDQRDAHDAMAGFDVDAAPDVFQGDREIAGNAGDHGVGIAERHHARGEAIAVLIDQPLTVSLQITVALQPLV